MSDEKQSSNVSLEKVLLLAKDKTNISALEHIIRNAIEDSEIFLFDALLDLPNIIKLGKFDVNTKEKNLYNVLELFAHGTWNDYSSDNKKYGKLTDKATRKLKQLSIVTLASSSNVLHYSDLLKNLKVDNIRNLEDMMIDLIYKGLLTAKLNPKEGKLHVQTAVGRDFSPNDIPDMLVKLENWLTHSKSLIKNLKSKQNELNRDFQQKKDDDESWSKKREKITKEERQIRGNSRSDMDKFDMRGRRGKRGQYV